MYSFQIYQILSISMIPSAHLFQIKLFINNSSLAHLTLWYQTPYIAYALANTLGQSINNIDDVLWWDQIFIVVLIIMGQYHGSETICDFSSLCLCMHMTFLHRTLHLIFTIPLSISPVASTRLWCWHIYQAGFHQGQHISHNANNLPLRTWWKLFWCLFICTCKGICEHIELITNLISQVTKNSPPNTKLLSPFYIKGKWLTNVEWRLLSPCVVRIIVGWSAEYEHWEYLESFGIYSMNYMTLWLNQIWPLLSPMTRVYINHPT